MPDTPAATVSDSSPESAKWTRFLPEWGGIRENIQNSPFRWCVRESVMWGIATGAAMGFHRIRMKSSPLLVINAAFVTTAIVTGPSYYFCYRRREHKEATIEMMMKANDFQHYDDMPEPIPKEQHPFLENGNEDTDVIKQKEFVARLKEKKEWQKQEPMDDASNVFKEVKKDR